MNSHPLYIAPDEEIISVIARLRSLEESDVTLVFPKNSVVTQSIINLKLLSREGEKLQKNLCLVSQNENARSLAEKLGFSTLPYTSDLEKGNLYLQSEGEDFTPVSIPEPMSSIEIEEETEQISKPKSSQIGSNTFHTAVPNQIQDSVPVVGDIKSTQKVIEEVPEIKNPTTSIRVRNNSPERLPSLNSVRYEETQKNSSSDVTPVHNPNVSNEVSPAKDTPVAIKNFFAKGASTPEPAPIRMPKSFSPIDSAPDFTRKESVLKKSAAAPVMVHESASRKLQYVLWGIMALIVVTSGSLFFFITFPKATVTVVPQSLEEATDQSFTLSLTNPGSNEIPLEKVTREITVSIAGIASGASNSSLATNSGNKAKGKITVNNTFSSEPQPLVATTRFEGANGKIYRTPSAVTIPGNGSLEIEVVADGAGEDYNVESTTFTIPGFKGSDKYEKITATSLGSITGGSGDAVPTGGTFIRADEEVLRSRAAESAKQQFSDELQNDTDETYTFTDGLVAERITEENLPKVGTTPGDYSYNAVFKITAYSTSKAAVIKSLIRNVKTNYDGITFEPTNQVVSFTDFTVDEKGESATLKAHLDTTLKASIDKELIKKDIAGKSKEEMSSFTEIHPEIKSLEATFKPTWALKRIPSKAENIEVVVKE